MPTNNQTIVSIDSDHFKKLSHGEVHIWQVSIHDNLPVELTPSELLRLRKMKSEVAQKEFKAMRKAVRYLASSYLSLPPEDLMFEKGCHGKPYVVGVPDFSFSLTHSKEVLLLAFSRHFVGLDLEAIRPVNIMAIAARYFTLEELSLLKLLTQEEREQQFFQLWVAKEAALKADGCGIAHGIKKAVSYFEEKTLKSIHLDKKEWFIHSWAFSHGDRGFLGGLATSFSAPTIQWHKFY